MSENRRVFLSKITIDMQVGVGLVTGQGSDPVVMLRYAVDSGYLWSDFRTLKIGRIGEYLAQVQSWRFGYGRNWAFELSGTDPNILAILDLYFDATEGYS